MRLGYAFYADWLSGSTPHIYFVACETDNPHPQIVLFNFTTHRPGMHDETCIITPSEFPPLKHDSVVAYRHGEIMEGLALDHLRCSGLSRKLPEVIRPEIIRKIQEGAIASKFTNGKIKTLIKAILAS